jgi:NAD(P)-dependent dehydrogenase (short-subunit alcohol dehydrogenase family)
VNRAVNDFGGLDIFVNNAAFQATHETIEEITDEEWDHTFRTNIYSMFYLVKAAVPHLQAGQRHNQHRFDQLQITIAEASRLRDDKGRDRSFSLRRASAPIASRRV